MSGPIVVGVDFSPESERAVAHAMALARHSGREVALVHACNVFEPPLIDEQPSAASEQYRALVEADLRANREALEALRARLSGQGAPLSHAVVDGFPDTALVDAARELDGDLIVVGSHGRTGLRWLLLGSVAQRVVRLSAADVLVARGDAVPGGYGKIMVATDFSASAEAALRAALELARPGAQVELVHMWTLPPVVPPFATATMPAMDGLAAAVRADLKVRGRRLALAHTRPGLEIQFTESMRSPLPGLVELAAERGSELVVLGSHGRRGVRRFVLGSVAEEVARRAGCSVLVVHRAH